MSSQIEVKYDCVNWWGDEIYRTKGGKPILYDSLDFFTLTDDNDIDSDPDRLLKRDVIKVVEKFSE